MIKAEELTKRRGGRAGVSDVTFCCEPGTVTGFLGPHRRRQDHDDAHARRPVHAR
jgi:ABC-type hemin transport system ATPase subunit